MHSGAPRSLVIGFIFLAALGLRAQNVHAQQPPAIEIAFPSQLARGQTTVVHIAIPSRATFTGAEVSPAAGVTVAGVAINRRPELSQNVAWWDVTIQVARDAAPGRRTLALLMPAGRSTAATVVIPGHVPAISDLRVVQAGASAVDVQFSAMDESSDFGESPYVWFSIACGRGESLEPTVGVVRGKASAGTVRASIPRPAAAPCDLELRASDTQKLDSNTLKTRIP